MQMTEGVCVLPYILRSMADLVVLRLMFIGPSQLHV